MILFITENSIDFNNCSSLEKPKAKIDQNGIDGRTKKFINVSIFIEVVEKRLVFPKGKQREFLEISKKELNINWLKFAEKLGINRGTLEKSYRYEICKTLPYKVFVKIIKLRNLKENEVLNNYKIKIIASDPSLVAGGNGFAFGDKIVKLPCIALKFKKPAPYFDISKIKLNRYDKSKGLKFPEKLTPELAEEIGMHVGDGFLSKRRNEYRLKGNKNDEKEYYDSFIKSLYKRLYNLDVNIKEYETTYGFEIASEGFWIFKNKILGLPAGRKNDMNLPEIIKVNDKKILTSFIRGLFDTDGCVSFIRKYKKLGNYYPTICISLKSKKLIKGLAEMLQMLGLEPKWYKDRDSWKIFLYGYERLAVYSKMIGWSNPKHVNKVIKWKKNYPSLSKDVMVGVV